MGARIQDPWSFTRRDPDKPKSYLTVPNKRINATAALNLLKSGYQAVKIHQYSLQSESDGQTIFFYDVTTTAAISQNWVFNAREGVISPFSREGLIIPASIGHDVGINLANSTYINFSLVYSNEDETIDRS